MGAEQSTEAVPADATQQAENGSTQQTTQSTNGSAAEPSALVICGPSGVGKGTLINKLMQDSDRFGFSVSHTTRQPRPGETDGVHYHYTTKENFLKEIGEGKFLEHAEVHGNIYGTSISAVQSVLKSGKVCILDIDVQGARSVRKSGLKAIFVFVAPPSQQELERRLRARGTETEEQVQKRINGARKELESVNEKGLFDYLLINDDLNSCYKRLVEVAGRALSGLDPEPGQVPEKPLLEQALANGAAKAVTPGAPTATTAVPVTAAVGPVEGAVKLTGTTSAPGTGIDRWAGKVALVTGASSGIGWAACEALATAGLRVVAVARRRENLEKLQSHMSSLGITPQTFLPVVCDVTKDAEVQALPKIVSGRWQGAGIDVLVNNAGLSRNDASLFDGNTAAWVEMISTNLLGTCMCTREVVKSMKARNSWGHIINMVGLSGHRIPDGPTGGGFYCATKYGVRAVTEGLRQEARGQGVPLRVSSISPGMVETEFFSVRSYGDETAAKKATSQFPCLQPQDIAQAMLWCLSAPDHMEVNDVVVRPTQQLI